jgi:cyanophycin synthetase
MPTEAGLMTAFALDTDKPASLWAALLEHDPDRWALITPEVRWRWRDLHQAVAARIATHKRMGVRGTVALYGHSQLELALHVLALSRCGLAFVSIPRSLSHASMHDWIQGCGVQWCLSDLASLPDPLLSLQPCVTTHAMDALQFEQDTQPLAKDTEPEPQGDALFMVIGGSGSTGQRKLIAVSHAQMQARLSITIAALQLSQDDRSLGWVHLEYASAMHRLLAALYSGGVCMLIEGSMPQSMAWALEQQVTVMSCAVIQAEALIAFMPRQLPWLQLRLLTVAGSVVSEGLRQRIREVLTPHLAVVYGTNECWYATLTSAADLPTVRHSIGWPAPGVEVRLVQADGAMTPHGAVGFLEVRSRALSAAYMGPQAPSMARDAAGWFRTGDLARALLSGELIFCGRSDNMMIFNGINIFPIEIEQCLLSHPDVVDVVAMPLSHAIHQDIPCAVVVLQPQAMTTQEQLQRFVADALGVKQPRRLMLVNEIPRNPQGKPDKEALVKILSTTIAKSDPLTPAHADHSVAISFIPKETSASVQLASWTRMLGRDDWQTESDSQDFVPDLVDAHGWLKQVLALTLRLMQTARIPVFDPIRVLNCSPDADKRPRWRAICAFPDPIWLPTKTMTELLRQAFKLAEWACTADIHRMGDRAYFFQLIERGPLTLLSFTRSRGKSTFELLQVAHHLSIPYRPLFGGIYQLGWGRHARRIDRSTTDGDSTIGMGMARDKFLTAKLLREAGLPAPVHGRSTSLAHAQEIAQRLGYPVVVKPIDLERGEGVVVDVNQDSFEDAFHQAFEKSPTHTVLVERQVPGVCHRLFIVAGALLYAVKRLPMGVYGDGCSSISDLVSAECERQQQRAPWLSSGIQPLDAIALGQLLRQGWAPEGIPAAGQFVALRRIETTAWGGVDEEVTHTIHPDNVAAAIRATRLFGLEVAGVDFMSPDMTQPWHANGAVINEINYAPLLGGGEISRKHIPDYLSLILKDKGRIPIQLCVGGEEAWEQARAQWTSWRECGMAAYLTNENQTWDGQGQAFTMVTKSLKSRVQGLLLNLDVCALVVVCPSEAEAQALRAIIG